MPAVYFIHTQDFSHYYIGSTKIAPVRFKHHRTSLRGGRHHCERLQRVFNKVGEDALRFSVAVEFDSRDQAALVEQELLDFHFRKPGCLNVSSNGIMPAHCPLVVAKRVASLRSPEHRAAASTIAKQWRAANPDRAREADRKSAATRAASVSWKSQNSERVKKASTAPEAKAAFVARIKRFYENGGVNGFAKPVIRIADDGTETRFESAAAAVKVTSGASGTTVSRCCMGRSKSTAGYRWRFA